MWKSLTRILLAGGQLSRAGPERNNWTKQGARRVSQLRGAMRLVQFHPKGSAPEPRIGLEEEAGGRVMDLNTFDPTLPRNMRAFLEAGEAAFAVAQRYASTHGWNCSPDVYLLAQCSATFRSRVSCLRFIFCLLSCCVPWSLLRTLTASCCAHRARESGQPLLPRDQVTLLAPVTNPDKVICVGMNYGDHCLEQNVKVPTEPIIFSKFPSSIVGPDEDIIHPAESNEVDWEVELAFVIGKRGKHIQASEAMDHVAGFTVAHDVSARDWQMKRNGKQWLLGKTFDTFCPLGPALVTKDSVSDPHNLGIRCRVNGELVQSSSTNQMIFRTEALVAWVSQFVTLYPGDVFLTGTPPGVGVFRKPPVFLKVKDSRLPIHKFLTSALLWGRSPCGIFATAVTSKYVT
ncbi:hypothetical protein JRQ81_011178 [Phrynocephalus forsythii]|uniref:Fumarylacetoacetase-like C-terminal domain-containing protein n=1 Tax=Phrynocephalus forsythii TaxID=171643 RepID=A0A9Q0X7N0_9SAUR|nr:hypothetical protein JRQ81_011178 [Phrynocephalus forsythii]